MNDRIRWSFARPTHRRFGALDPGEKQRLQRVRPCWRTTRHAAMRVSGRLRKRIEEVFGWTKTAAGFRKTRRRGLARVGWMFTSRPRLTIKFCCQAGGSRGVVTPGFCQTLRDDSKNHQNRRGACFNDAPSATLERITHWDLTNHSTMIFSAAARHDSSQARIVRACPRRRWRDRPLREMSLGGKARAGA